MKTALYIQDGLKQIVLTPETDGEKAILEDLKNGDLDFSIRTGSFFFNQGGYLRHGTEDHSTIIVMRKKTKEAAI